MAEISYQKRIRIEVSTSVKGVKTYSVTIERMDVDAHAVLQESDYLVAQLDERYPPQIENKKGE